MKLVRHDVMTMAEHVKLFRDACGDKADAWDSSYKGGSLEFTGTKCAEEALTLATSGWEEGAQAIGKSASGYCLNLDVGDSFANSWDVGGEVPDVPRYCAGDPAHMVSSAYVYDAPVLDLRVSPDFSGAVDKQNIQNFGAALLVLVDMLERGHGYSVRITNVLATCHGGIFALGETVVKEADAHLEIDRLAFCIGHPSMLRRFWFAWIGINHDLKFLGHGLGAPYEDHDVITKVMTEKDPSSSPVLITGANTAANQGHFDTIDKALKWLISQLPQQTQARIAMEAA